MVAPQVIPDYAATAGQVREGAKQLNHKQPGDPARLAQAVLRLVDAERPPLRLALGSDFLRAIAEKNVRVTAGVWAELSRQTDFPG